MLLQGWLKPRLLSPTPRVENQYVLGRIICISNKAPGGAAVDVVGMRTTLGEHDIAWRLGTKLRSL